MIRVCLTLIALASPQDDGVTVAADAYRDGRFEEALVRFEAELDEPGARRGALLHDMGSCSFRLGRYAEALLLYRRARAWLPDDPTVNADLRTAERQLGVDGPSARSFDRPGDERGLLWLAAALQAAGLGGLLFLPGSRARRWASVAVAAVGVSLAARVVHDAMSSGVPLGVVLAPGVTARAEPHLDFPQIADLQVGETVRVEEASDRWARVTRAAAAAGAVDGWVRRDGIGLVER